MSLVVVALPEDRASDALSVMQEFVLHALGVCAGVDRSEVRFEPAGKDIASLAVGGRWKSKEERTRLARYVVTELGMGHLVVLHVDSDVAWPTEPPVAKLLGQLRRAVHHGIAGDNFVVMLPYTAIESWTYRNTAHAHALADAADSARCGETHSVWRSSPELLETTVAAKNLSPLRDRHNLRLVRHHWPVVDAYADGRSFRAFADALAECPAIRPSDP